MSVKDFFVNDIKETLIPQEATVYGHLPKWLQGTYYKITNGKHTLPSGFQMNHMFDGFALIYQYEIGDNKIRFKSKYLDSSAYKEAMEFGKPTYPEMGTRHFTNPNKSLISRTFSSIFPFDISDNNFGNIFTYRDKIFVNNVSCFLHEIDPDTLLSRSKLDLRSIGIHFTTAHYLLDQSGALYNFVVMSKFGLLKLAIVQFIPLAQNGGDTNTDVDSIDVKKDINVLTSMSPSSFATISPCHSFGMTENYFVAIEQPIQLNIFKMAVKIVQGKTPLESFTFDPNEKTKFIIIDRATGNAVKTKYYTVPFFYVHIVNLFEDDDCLVFDVITYENADLPKELLMCKLRNDDFNQAIQGTVKRFVLPIKNFDAAKENENLVKLSNTSATAVKVDSETIFSTSECLFDIPMDTLRFNENFIGKKYRFGYSFIVFQNHKFQKHLLKYDILSKEIKTWKSDNEAHFACEPFFVPNPEGVDEDDGIVIAVLAEANIKRSALVFLDAKSFVEIARAEFLWQVNFGNHGLFVFNKQTTEPVHL